MPLWTLMHALFTIVHAVAIGARLPSPPRPLALSRPHPLRPHLLTPSGARLPSAMMPPIPKPWTVPRLKHHTSSDAQKTQPNGVLFYLHRKVCCEAFTAVSPCRGVTSRASPLA